MMGMVWGWLPCGLVYSVLLLAAASGSSAGGAFTMLCFGLGTLPSMITAGMAAGGLRRWLQRAAVKKSFAVIIILFGVMSPWLHMTLHNATGNATTPASHQHH